MKTAVFPFEPVGKKPVHLIGKHLHRSRLSVSLSDPRDGVRRLEYVVRVDARLAVQSVPDLGRKVEEYGLEQQYEGYPLVVGNRLLVVRSFRNLVAPRNVVSVLYPAIIRCKPEMR